MESITEKMFIVEKLSDFSEEDKEFLKEMFYERLFSEKESYRYVYLSWQDEKLLPKSNELTDEELAYRRDYAHGVACALQGKVNNEDVRKWRQGKRITGAPGTSLENVVLQGLVKSEFGKFMPD